MPFKLALGESDWRWLGEKQSINIATYSPENPPFMLIPEPGIFEGIAADYTLLTLHYLGLRFKTLHYTSRASALEGLQAGAVDVVLEDGGVLTLPQGLVSTPPYMPDHPALISRETVMSSQRPSIQYAHIAMVHGYLSDEWVTSNYPGASITRYASVQSALSSVAFGENDYFIGSITAATYQIERNYTSTLTVADIFTDIECGPRFVFRADQTVLQRSFNAVLQAIPATQHKVIFRQWSQGSNLWRFQSRLALTEREERWLARNRELRVVINPLFTPFTLFDTQDQFHGISADILRQIHLRTGLNFKTVEAYSVKEMFDLVKEHNGDFIAAMSHSPQRDKQLLFTRPYVLPPFVLVVRDTLNAPKDLKEKLTVAVTPDNNLRFWLKEHYPSLTIIDADNASLAMQMVKEGKADGSVNNLMGARYLIERYFRGELRIAASLGEEPARISFAVGRDQPELYSILNKALADIPPREISLIVNKWLGVPDVKLDTWIVYRTEFYWLAGIFAILVITSLIWNYYLHREIYLRKEAQAKLQEQVAFREILFDGTPVPVYVTDTKGNIISYNPAWTQFFAEGEVALNHGNLTSLQHPQYEIFRDLQPLLEETGNEAPLPQQYRISNGKEERVVVHQAVTYRDHTGAIAGLIGCWQDTTEHESLLAALSDARERAEQSNRTKSCFLATMSHEIRTPISAIIGLLELVVTSPGCQYVDSEKKTIQVAYESALTLMGLVGDILDMAKIESGKLELTSNWVRPDALAQPIVLAFEGLARQKGLQLDYHDDALHPDEISIDPIRIRQILSNLLSNAIKFTEHGAVTVTLQCQTKSTTEAMLTLTVSDTGKGIAEHEQADLFTPYVQTEIGKIQQGTGLGLAICSQLTTMMKGTIELHSEPDRGTRITVKVPVHYRQQQAPQSEISVPIVTGKNRPLRILAVDDHPANRLLLTHQLTRLGHYVTEAENGEQALRIWQQQTVDLVITDCNMPVMDGLELTQHLRERQTAPLTILGLTANVQPEERIRCMAAGMDDCMFKPLRLSQLDQILQQIPLYHSQKNTHSHATLGELVDLTSLLALTQGDRGLLVTLLRTTCDENRRDMEQSRTHFNHKDWKSMARSLHRLAGAAQIIGAGNVESSCHYLEKYCENTDSPKQAHIERHLEQILTELDELNHVIETLISS